MHAPGIALVRRLWRGVRIERCVTQPTGVDAAIARAAANADVITEQHQAKATVCVRDLPVDVALVALDDRSVDGQTADMPERVVRGLKAEAAKRLALFIDTSASATGCPASSRTVPETVAADATGSTIGRFVPKGTAKMAFLPAKLALRAYTVNSRRRRLRLFSW